MILKLGINKVKRSEFNDMSLMIPIIIDLMNFIDLIKVDLFDKKSKDFIKVYYGWSFIKDLRKSFGGKINNINVSEKFISVFLNTYINIESKHDSSDDVTTVIDDLVIISPLKGNN